MVLRLAPSALRTASSFCRVMPRASSRLATLTHAMSRMKPTAPRRSQRVCFRSLGRKSFLSGSTKDAPALVALGIGLGDVGGDGVHVGLRLLDGDAGFEAAHGEQPVKVVVDLLGLEDQRHGQLALAAIVEAGREDADDGVGLAVHAHGCADDFGIGSRAVPRVCG